MDKKIKREKILYDLNREASTMILRYLHWCNLRILINMNILNVNINNMTSSTNRKIEDKEAKSKKLFEKLFEKQKVIEDL